MAYICITLNRGLEDGMKISFKAPCDCNTVDGLKITFIATSDISTDMQTKEFTFYDANAKDMTGIGNLFCSGALVEVMLDVTNSRAYILNAGTSAFLTTKITELENENSLLESNIQKMELNTQLLTKDLILTQNLHYGDDLPTPGTKGRIFFKRAII